MKNTQMTAGKTASQKALLKRYESENNYLQVSIFIIGLGIIIYGSLIPSLKTIFGGLILCYLTTH